MKKENLSAALNDIDFDMVEDAYDSAHSNSQRKNKLFRLPHWGAIAACLCLVIAVGVLVSPTLENAFRDEAVGEETLVLVGNTLVYDNGTIVYHTDNYTDRTLAFTLEKEDDSPICLVFRGSRTVEDDEDHCEVISPYSGYEPITRNATVVDNLLTIYVNGVETDALPAEAGSYEIVVNYSQLDDFLDAGYYSVWLVGFNGLKTNNTNANGIHIGSQLLPPMED